MEESNRENNKYHISQSRGSVLDGEDGDGGVGSTGAAGTLIDGGWSIASGC